MRALQARDLRIGCNFQLENGVLGGGIATIKNKFDLDVAFDLLEYNLIKPIPLTEEWLERLSDIEWESFLFGNRRFFKHKKFQSIEIEYSNGQVFVYFDNELINIKYYMHQLQDIFFALTGKELTLKE